jgi:general secretion pathway protein D
MKYRNKKLKTALIVALCLMSRTLKSEPQVNPGNPFGGTEPVVPGQQYQEEDDFLDPQANPGGFEQPQNFGNPPPSDANNQPSQPQQSSPPPEAPVQPERPPTTRSNGGNSNTGSSRVSAPSKAKQMAAPTLPDYLELDSAVKGLEVKNFDLPDKEIKDVVTLISKWTGKNFILDSKVRGKITIMGPAQVTLQEAYQAFLSALEANGLTTVQAGKFIRVIESAEARRSPVKTYAGEYAPKDDQFITRIFQLKFINADEVQREFRDLTTRQGKLFAYEPTNSIIITDTGSNINRIKEILDVMDVKGFETTLHVLKIKHSSAKTISDMLGEIYGDEKGRPGQPRSFRKSALERTRGGGIISKIIPDEQTNSLVVLANAAGYQQLKQLVGKLDVRVTDTGRIHVYYCEYAKAEDLATTLASLSGGGRGGASGGRRTSATSPNALGGGATAPTAPTGPVTAELDGGVKITSDASTNALVITANSSDYQTLKRVIKKLDIPRLQVFVETAIMEVVLDDTSKVGVNAALGAPGIGFAGGFIGDQAALATALSRGVPSEGATIPVFGGPSFSAKTMLPGASTATDITVNTFMGLINLLSKTTNSSLLSTPQILALDNEQAEFQVLDETPVVSSTSVPTATSPGVSSVERLKTGIVIKLTPHVNAASRMIRLDISQKVDTVRQNSQVPAALQSSNVATTSRVTNTAVTVRDQDFLMMGGLMADKVDETLTKVPLLGDIPILGWLFKSRTNKVLKTNLVILLHPKIINTSYAAAQLSKEGMDKRRKFIDKNMGGEEFHPDEIQEIEKGIDDQFERSKSLPAFDYRNNADDDSLEKDPELLPEKPSSERRESRVRPERKEAIPEKPLLEETVPPAEAPINPPPGDVLGLPEENAVPEISGGAQ